MRRKTNRVKKKYPDGFIGDLENCPYMYQSYTCRKCNKTWSFLSGLRCYCEKQHKFKAKQIIVNGIKFPSLFEGMRYSKLSFLYKKEVITRLRLQPKFALIVNEQKIGNYIADFEYVHDKKLWVEDTKGKETQVFKLKKKIIEATFPELNLVMVRR